jgi:hypothetical protein
VKLVHSSVPGAVERDQAIRLLTERAVLTRMVCRELFETNPDHFDRRPLVALHHLLGWIATHYPDSLRGEPHAADGLDGIEIPKGLEALFQEIKAGAKVCEAFFMLTTADNDIQYTSDRVHLSARLESYWQSHPTPVPVAYR